MILSELSKCGGYLFGKEIIFLKIKFYTQGAKVYLLKIRIQVLLNEALSIISVNINKTLICSTRNFFCFKRSYNLQLLKRWGTEYYNV